MPNPFTRLDDAVIDRVAQIGKTAWLHHTGKLDGAEVAWSAVLLAMLAVNYAIAWDVSASRSARNPARISPFLRVARLVMLTFTATLALALVFVLSSGKWDIFGVLLLSYQALYTATLYAAACDNLPPPVAKTSAVHAGAGA